MEISWRRERVCLLWTLGSVIAICGADTLGDTIKGYGARGVSDRSAQVVDGTLTLDFFSEVLDDLDLRFLSQGNLEPDGNEGQITFEVDSASTFAVETPADDFTGFGSGRLQTCGAILLDRPGERIVVGNLALKADAEGVIHVVSTLDRRSDPEPLFQVISTVIELDRASRSFGLSGELILSDAWAAKLGVQDSAGVVVGRITVDAALEARRTPAGSSESCAGAGSAKATQGEAAAAGPDILVAELSSVVRFDRLGDITSYAVGTAACNIGTARANWISYTNQHPVIIQNLYRLDPRGFQQIGMSWVKHGFYAVSQSLCGTCNDPTEGNQLGVNCSDPYSAPLNGAQNNMSPRSAINGHTGYFQYPLPLPFALDKIERRLQAHDADLDPAQNDGARYFIEGHYVAADDAAAGNQDNNASYREVRVSRPAPDFYVLAVDPLWPTQRGRPAVRAWRDTDPSVVETDVRVPGEGLFILGANAVPTGTGMWRYSYALQNLNSDRSAGSFRVPLPPDAVMQDIAFHDVDHHSGEPYDTDEWEVEVSEFSISWSTWPHSAAPNANALRYDAIFNFAFSINAPPVSGGVVIGLFKPGTPTEVSAATVIPKSDFIDCNGNRRQDACDLDCNAEECEPPCGTSADCNENGVPDECEPDCNHNGVADNCDLRDCPLGERACADCNHNTVPDGCDPDCDRDGLPDDCDVASDTDGDGITDCFDSCPTSTPLGACVCPAVDRCCYPAGFCIPNYPRWACLDQGGTPDCLQAPCRLGCLLGDCDDDGHIDLWDFRFFQACFSGDHTLAGFVMPSEECLIPMDFDEDDDVDIQDYGMLRRHMTAP